MPSVSTDRRIGFNASAAIKVAAICASTGNLTLSGEQTVDGIACVEGDRVFAKDQTDATENGIYKVSTGTWTREPDFDGTFDVREGTIVPVSRGTVNGGSLWRITNIGTIVIGTTSLTVEESLIVTSANAVSYAPAGELLTSTDVASALDELDSDRFVRQRRDIKFTPTRDYTSATFTIFDGVSQTEHYHGCRMCVGVGGRLHMTYRNASEHGVEGQWSLHYTYSDNGGRTWATEAILKTGSATKGYVAGGVLQTPSGRLVAPYNDLTVDGASVQSPVVYGNLISADNGATWTDGAQIDSISFSYARIYGRPKMFPYQNSLGYRLSTTAYHQTGTGPSTYASTVYYSDDDGSTWTEGTPFVDDTAGHNEAECVFVSDKVGFAVTRGTNASLFTTVDGG